MLKQTFLTVLVLLACCVALMEGAHISSQERCSCKAKGRPFVNMSLVAKIEYHMRSGSCNQEELIVVFRTGKRHCLDINGDQGRRIKQAIMERSNDNQRRSN